MEAQNYLLCTKNQLIDYCLKYGIAFVKTQTKSQLIDLIEKKIKEDLDFIDAMINNTIETPIVVDSPLVFVESTISWTFCAVKYGLDSENKSFLEKHFDVNDLKIEADWLKIFVKEKLL